ncbi:hypothetical protein MDA_GLEAN10021306 [Myotis davidii]|uniref:Uncharacterized protein n=1 Tax=Myotis davidii TaxID=225400 RepID=L5MGF2_MYODS|nr:hypothetical protein MDA_GLEAN10021306 [Myotis davidii]
MHLDVESVFHHPPLRDAAAPSLLERGLEGRGCKDAAASRDRLPPRGSRFLRFLASAAAFPGAHEAVCTLPGRQRFLVEQDVRFSGPELVGFLAATGEGAP